VDRRSFCVGLLALPAVASAAQAQAQRDSTVPFKPAVWDHFHELRFLLNDPLEHPFYWWPRTLLSYPIDFRETVDLDRLVLMRIDTREQVPLQFSNVVRDGGAVRSATLNFFSDLPSGARREFALTLAATPAATKTLVTETQEGDTLVLDSGTVRVRIPASRDVHGDAPGPILQVARGGAWIGSSVLSIIDDKVTRITATRVADGPLFIAYALAYETVGGSHYAVLVQCNAGMDFVRLEENMEGLRPGAKGTITSNWSGFGATHRQAPNHPYPTSGKIHKYEEYPWEKVGEPWSLHPVPLPGGELPFALGIYQTWTAFRTGTFANFWDEHTDDALGVFIDKADAWQDHEYAYHVESPTLQVRYFYNDGQLSWQWPLSRGSRSTCVAYYDHAKDKEAMHQLEQDALGVDKDGFNYRVGLIFSSYTHLLQSRYGTLDLNCVKDWVLEYPEGARRAPVIFSTGSVKSADDLEKRVMAGPFVCTLPVNGTRQNGGASPEPGRGIVNFSPVPSRQVLGWWIDGYNRHCATMNASQRRRITAMYLFMAYVCAGDEFMPLVPMLSGHPNFLADVRAVPPAMSFLFPDHPMARPWADMWEKYVEINTRYNTRPDVKSWDAMGGRWTENLGTYVWAFLRPSLRTDYLVRNFDGSERFANPHLAQMAEWLVNALSAPFNGETPEAYHDLQVLDDGHEWGAAKPGMGPRRVHPPQGAHAERRIPPRSLWYLGTCLRRYAPLAAEHAMWAARPANQDMETAIGADEPFDAMYRVPDNLGTNPHLRSRKLTGYGIMMRAAVDTPDEVSIHLQQIDQGPNYRWGVAAEGGCGVIYYFAAGQAYSYNGAEDVGDRGDQDTDFCTCFGVFRDGQFRSIGENVLSRPFYDLSCGQFAEIVPREDPGAYSWPEYVSRSILLAGHDYFLLHDAVLHGAVDHRLSWYVRRGSELPTMKFIGGVTKDKSSQRTEIQTAASTGIWIDGAGDSMVVVSHRKDIDAETKPWGCRVHAAEFDDLVFRNTEAVHYVDGMTSFSGTAGLIRTRKGAIEFALFHGTRIGVGGLTLTTTDTDLGIGGTVPEGQPASGTYYATKASSVRVARSGLTEKHVFYVDGVRSATKIEADGIAVELNEGLHRWELTDRLPVPIAPRIMRTENHAGGARVIAEQVGSAAQYRFEISKDMAATWVALGTQAAPEFILNGLADGTKVHVRAVALNALHESEPGAEYPLYVTKDAPPQPEGLHVALTEGMATLTWGEVLGVSEYRLYARVGKGRFSVVYRGLDRTYQDKGATIHAALAVPNEPGRAPDANVVEYYVTAANGNGEGPKSRTADTNPASWRNWDPQPGEAFSRRFTDTAASASTRISAAWPDHYPR